MTVADGKRFYDQNGNSYSDSMQLGKKIGIGQLKLLEDYIIKLPEGVSISDGYTLDLDATKSEDFSGYGLQTLDNGNVAYLNREENTAGWKKVGDIWKYFAENLVSGDKGFELSGIGSIDGISVNDGVVTINQDDFNDDDHNINLVSNDGGYIFDFTNSYGNYFCGKEIISDGNYVDTDSLTFKLTANLDLVGGNYCICDETDFDGTFDGNGHAINNVSYLYNKFEKQN